jgi:hypothetical protein
MARYYDYKYDYSKNITSQDEVNIFLKKYQAEAGLSKNKVYARRKPIRYQDWLSEDAGIPFHQEIEREPLVEMYIPQDKFRDLVERDRWVGKLEGEAEYYRKRYMQEIEDDKVRSQNPAVKKAWEQYQMLLELAR